jgi:hypothetical protein
MNSVSQGPQHRRGTGSQALGIACRREPRPAPSRPGPPRRSQRPPRAHLWLLHRRLRHPRPQRGEGTAQRAKLTTNRPCGGSNGNRRPRETTGRIMPIKGCCRHTPDNVQNSTPLNLQNDRQGPPGGRSSSARAADYSNMPSRRHVKVRARPSSTILETTTHPRSGRAHSSVGG